MDTVTEDIWIPTCCNTCFAMCGILAHRVNERVIKLEGDPNCPHNLGKIRAKGFAEASTIGVSGCIANAIYNAVGIRFRELPIAPEKIFRALRAREGKYL